MSAFTADGDFVPRLPAHPLSADATADPSFGRLMATTSHLDNFGDIDSVAGHNIRPILGC